MRAAFDVDLDPRARKLAARAKDQPHRNSNARRSGGGGLRAREFHYPRGQPGKGLEQPAEARRRDRAEEQRRQGERALGLLVVRGVEGAIAASVKAKIWTSAATKSSC